MLNSEQEKKFYKQVGELIKSNRLKRDVSHDSLASFIGLSRPSIINIESGRQKILLHTLMEVAEFLNVTVSELIPTKSSAEHSINEGIKTKINQKVASENQLNKFESFINLSVSTKPKE